MESNHFTLIGTFGGTVLSMTPNLNSEDLYRTIALAAIGAIVSFMVSLLLKVYFEHRDE